jgi:5'-nucleotidase
MLPPTAVRTVGGVKIGFIGETLQGTARDLSAPAAKGLSFQEESSVANEAAARLEKEGVHAIVLLIHQGGQQRGGQGGGQVDPNGCANFGGGISAVASKLSPSIKVVISGHTHQFYNCTIYGHTVTSAGSYGRLFTRVNLSIDPATDTIVNVTAKNEVVTRDVTKDPAQTAILEKYRAAAGRIANRTVGSVTGAFNRTRGPSGESTLGELIADAQLASVSAPEKGGAVVAFMNSGGIRTNISVVGNVSYGDLYAVQPFGNRILVFTMTGDMLRRLLEQQFGGRGGGQLLQISEGFTYQYKSQAPAGEHVVPGSIAINGHQVAPTDQVRVAASDFLQNGGDGFTVFREATDVTVGPLDIEALVAYVTAHSPVAPGALNRVVRVE